MQNFEVSRYARAPEQDRDFSAPRMDWSWVQATKVFRGTLTQRDIIGVLESVRPVSVANNRGGVAGQGGINRAAEVLIAAITGRVIREARITRVGADAILDVVETPR